MASTSPAAGPKPAWALDLPHSLRDEADVRLRYLPNGSSRCRPAQYRPCADGQVLKWLRSCRRDLGRGLNSRVPRVLRLPWNCSGTAASHVGVVISGEPRPGLGTEGAVQCAAGLGSRW
jgi:hypothetical protein